MPPPAPIYVLPRITAKFTCSLNCLCMFPSSLLQIIFRFTFRVLVEIEETSRVIESYGEAQAKKKDAAEHAAEGALWFLKQEGYLLDN